MADITVKGYCNKPATKEGTKGQFSTFTLSERIKDPKAEKGFRRAFYNVTDFNNAEPPADGAFVTVQGWLKPREYEVNGVKKLANDIVCQKLEVAPPRDGGAAAAGGAAGDAAGAPADQKDPWDLG